MVYFWAKLFILDYFSSEEKEFKFVKEDVSEAEVDLACLDHAYFQEELEKLTRLLIDVKRERFEVRGAKGTSHEWTVLGQIEIQLDNLYIENEDLMQFNIKQRLDEVYNMAETLFKIKTGKLGDDFMADQEALLYDENDYEDDYYDDQYYNETPTDFYEDEIYYSKKFKSQYKKQKR